MLKRLLTGLAVGGALTLDQALRPENVADRRQASSAAVIDEAEDGYEGTVRATGGGFMPAGETRENVWVHQDAQPGARSLGEVLAVEEAARANVPTTQQAMAQTLEVNSKLREAGLLHYEMPTAERLATHAGILATRAAHTCRERPAEICEACLESNR